LEIKEKIMDIEFRNVNGSRVGFIIDNDIKDSNGNRVGIIVGNDIKDSYGNRVGMLNGSDIKDINGNRVGMIIGNDIKDTYGNRVGYPISDASQFQMAAAGLILFGLKLEAAPASSPINTSSSSASCENSPQYVSKDESKPVISGYSAGNIAQSLVSGMDESTVKRWAKTFEEVEQKRYEREQQERQEAREKAEKLGKVLNAKDKRNRIIVFVSLIVGMVLWFLAFRIIGARDGSELPEILLALLFPLIGFCVPVVLIYYRKIFVLSIIVFSIVTIIFTCLFIFENEFNVAIVPGVSGSIVMVVSFILALALW
jgi:hypothetical protein